MKTVTLPLYEYNKLLEIEEDYDNNYQKQRELLVVEVQEQFEKRLTDMKNKLKKEIEIHSAYHSAVQDISIIMQEHSIPFPPEVSIFKLKDLRSYRTQLKKDLTHINDIRQLIKKAEKKVYEINYGEQRQC